MKLRSHEGVTLGNPFLPGAAAHSSWPDCFKTPLDLQLHSLNSRAQARLRSSLLSAYFPSPFSRGLLLPPAGDLPGTEEPMFPRPVQLMFALGWNSEQGRVNSNWAKVSLSRGRPWAEWIRCEKLSQVWWGGTS